MSEQWQYQVRIDLQEELAGRARRDPADPALGRLKSILDRHDAIIDAVVDERTAEMRRVIGKKAPTSSVTASGSPSSRRKRKRWSAV